MKHAIIFKALWKEKKRELPSQKEVASSLNWDESFFSRFLLGKQDVKTELFLKLVATMPADFQIEYWTRVAKELELAGLPPSPDNRRDERSCPEIGEWEGGRGDEQAEQRIQVIADRFSVSVEKFRDLLDSMQQALTEKGAKLTDPRGKLTDENIEEISRETKIPTEELRRWQRGEKPPWPFSKVCKLAVALGVEVEEITATLGLDFRQSTSDEPKHHTEADCQNHHL